MGLTWDHLQSRSFHHLAHGSYAWSGLTADPMLMLQAAADRLPAEAVFSRRTAAWLHGLDVLPCSPIEVTLPKDCRVSSRTGISVRRSPLKACDIVQVQGMRATTMLRALLEIGESPQLVESIVVADQALRSGCVSSEQLLSAVEARAGIRYVKRLRRIADLADGRAESPMESRLRATICLAGLPRPQVQVNLHDDQGRRLARVDLYYPGHRLVIEFDGGTHRETLVEDNRRQNRILAAGYRLLRFTSADLRRPAAVVAQVRAALSAAA